MKVAVVIVLLFCIALFIEGEAGKFNLIYIALLIYTGVVSIFQSIYGCTGFLCLFGSCYSKVKIISLM